jgi:quercetin dioxygenase-like cupin family protein
MATQSRRQPSGDEPQEMVIVGPGGGQRFVRENRTVTIRLDPPQLSIHEIEFDTTFEIPPHCHEHVDAMLVLDGEIEVLGGAQPLRLGAGSLVAAPPGVRHGFRNPGPGRARILAMHAPDGGFAAMVRAT